MLMTRFLMFSLVIISALSKSLIRRGMFPRGAVLSRDNMETMFLSMRDNRTSRGIIRSQSELMKVSVTIPAGGKIRGY